MLVEPFDPDAAGVFTWLDPHNASVVLLATQVLLKLKGRGEIGVLVSSQEDMDLEAHSAMPCSRICSNASSNCERTAICATAPIRMAPGTHGDLPLGAARA